MFLPPLSPSKHQQSPQSCHHRFKSDSIYLPSVLRLSPVRLNPSPRDTFPQKADSRYYLADTSLGSIKRRQIQVERELRKYQEMKQRYEAIVSERKGKRELVRVMKDRFSLSLSRKEVTGKTLEQLKVAALTIVNGKIKQEAAGKIGKVWREKHWQREKRKSDALIDTAVRKIQTCWNSYIGKKRAVATMQIRTDAAIWIQRLWKGHRDRKRVGDMRKEANLQANFHYFAAMRETLLKSAAKVIWGYWRKYRARRANRLPTNSQKPASKPSSRTANTPPISSPFPASQSFLPAATPSSLQSPSPPLSLPEAQSCQVYRSHQVFPDT